MKNILIAIILLTTIPLAACEKRENPLTKADIDQLVTLVYANKTKEIEFCGLQWADPSAAKAEDVEKCKAIAEQVKELLEKNGFKELEAEDVEFPSLWIAFNKKIQRDERLKEKTKKFNELFTLKP